MTDRATAIPVGKYARTANGLTIHYHEAGVGDPVVFIHGAGPGASGYSNFKRNFPWLAEFGFRAIVPDLPGYGLSSKPEDVAYTLDFFVQALHEFLTAIGVNHCVPLGNSLGGAISIKYTLDHPECVSRLILMAPGGLEELQTYIQMEGIRTMIAAHSAGPIDAEAIRRVMSLQLYDPSLITEELLAERAGIAKTQPSCVLSTMRVPNMAAELNRIKCPVLGFWGLNDKFNPVSGAMKIVEGCQQARVILINRCGHWVMVEHRDMFNRACLDFLRNG
jgi:4,5:9,10-diseco-3-hydroxy-5,9,17-trioxoandrosta-1(10),2-diene-4-oate hydrolase